MHTEDGIASAPGSPSWFPSNRGEELRINLVSIDTPHDVTSASIIVSHYVRVTVAVVSDEVSDPIRLSRLVDGFTWEGDPQWV
jgi:hypothetical protein